MKEITVQELKTMIANNENFVLVDVREEHERIAANIGGEHYALSSFPNEFDKLDKSLKTVVYCRSGARSANACHFLMQNGFSDVSNLQGGILAWKSAFDPTLDVN